MEYFINEFKNKQFLKDLLLALKSSKNVAVEINIDTYIQLILNDRLCGLNSLDHFQPITDLMLLKQYKIAIYKNDTAKYLLINNDCKDLEFKVIEK